MKIETDDLTRPEVHALLREHLENMHALSPSESVHALDLRQLQQPGVTFWTAWEGRTLLGCGALKTLHPGHGEIKSMRTPAAHRRRGAGRKILQHILKTAKERGFQYLSLETGTASAFVPAHRLYETAGFVYFGPFGDYAEDANSIFMTIRL